MVKVQRLFAKTNLKIPIFRDEKIEIVRHTLKNSPKNEILSYTRKDTFKVNISLASTDIIQAEEILHKEKILTYISNNGKINNQEGRELLRLEKTQVTNLLNELIKESKIFRHGQGKTTYYDYNKIE